MNWKLPLHPKQGQLSHFTGFDALTVPDAAVDISESVGPVYISPSIIFQYLPIMTARAWGV
jgi:hypothetical protein